MSDIWRAVEGQRVFQLIGGNGFRLVECQETVATTEIVSSLERQTLLEQMLDSESKPDYRAGTNHLHYLLSTPFRYPPLRHGSRFGTRFEPSLFYGGTSERVTLCENAYYRFYFYHDMEVPPLHRQLQTQHTLFEFQYGTDSGAKLQAPPFDTYVDLLRDPAHYAATQALGTAMRDAGVKGFEYRSARDVAGGINVALFDASPFTSDKPLNEKSCLCQTTEHQVVFSIERIIIRFSLDQFTIDGDLPIPAA